MNVADQTLQQQLQINAVEFHRRKTLFSFTQGDVNSLRKARNFILTEVNKVVENLCQELLRAPEIAIIVSDAETKLLLAAMQKKYILQLFNGDYEMDYVQSRLKLGAMHKRLGVEPKLYLAGIYSLKSLLADVIVEKLPERFDQAAVLTALEKLLLLDQTLVLDSYLRGYVHEIEAEKIKVEQYAQILELKVKERTEQLEEISRTDPLTGLFNTRQLMSSLTQTLKSSQRRNEPMVFAYLDLNDLKLINDSEGHQKGDEAIRLLGQAMLSVSRLEDRCFRYGGDEFCVILPGCTEQEAVENYFVRLKEEVNRENPNLDFSVGVVQTGPDDFLEAEPLIKMADQKMYQQKSRLKASKLKVV